MRTTEDLAQDLRTLPRGALFTVPALTPEQRLRLDEINPLYLTSIENLRSQELPLTYAAAIKLLHAVGYRSEAQ